MKILGFMQTSAPVTAPDSMNFQPYAPPNVTFPRDGWLTRLWCFVQVQNSASLVYRNPATVRMQMNNLSNQPMHASINNDMVLNANAQDLPYSIYCTGMNGAIAERTFDIGAVKVCANIQYSLFIWVYENLNSDNVFAYWEYEWVYGTV